VLEVRIYVKRIYSGVADDDGYRILVDRLWPRGIKKEAAGVDLWLKEIAPSNELRKWYNHDPEKWTEFKTRYFQELEEQGSAIEQVLSAAKKGKVTLLFSSKELKLNNAVALKEYLEGKSGA
jgi:uncharacterized protein YeaO (DUF488 family)